MRKSRRVIAIMSVFSVFFSTLLFNLDVAASEHLVSGTAGTITYYADVDQDFSITSHNVSLPIDSEPYVSDWYGYRNYFYNYFAQSKIFTASPNVYAYKVKAVPSTVSTSFSQVPIRRLIVGSHDEFCTGDVVWGSQINASNNHNFWYVNDYKSIDVHMGIMVRAYQNSLYFIDQDNGVHDLNVIDMPNIYVYGSWTVTYTPYTKDDMLDEIYQELVKLNSNDDEMLAKIDKLIENTDNVEQLLEELIEILNSSEGSGSLEPLPDDDINGVIQGENDLIQDNSDLADDLDFKIDTNSNDLVWNIIETFLNSNAKVFGCFIGVLTLGIIALLLNR